MLSKLFLIPKNSFKYTLFKKNYRNIDWASFIQNMEMKLKWKYEYTKNIQLKIK